MRPIKVGNSRQHKQFLYKKSIVIKQLQSKVQGISFQAETEFLFNTLTIMKLL